MWAVGRSLIQKASPRIANSVRRWHMSPTRQRGFPRWRVGLMQNRARWYRTILNAAAMPHCNGVSGRDTAREDAMSLKDTVREKFEQAKRVGNREEKNLLSVILGDISTAEARSGKELPEAEVEKLLRKMVESNTESLLQMKSHNRALDPRVPVLEREIAFLKSLLPQTLDATAITKAL